ncbi:hypothetical protein [Aquimarina algiphila]|uniref:Protein SirB1 N-terminal domain-containing protein n=1 Tax=Aquimarina algiphila TaxID=2047982 RepID=A0A554VEE4_9FLAO|nr:hypothetical protein [Aquimarina algiphila]TSE05420.1 hypothetical protein FOF46_22925 [Aquimarina algiphila]
MKKTLIVFLLICITSTAQDRETLYLGALTSLTEMLQDSTKISFKKAVMIVENAYLHGTLDTLAFNDEIERLKKFTQAIYKNRSLLYKERDSLEVKKQAVLFSVMKDTIPYFNATGEYKHIPFTYDFEDIWGHKNWENMFVSKLLQTRKGNCHSLPYLYKILAQEIGTEAHLALAPNHVYIKSQNHKDGWYNTELTSGQFPNDAWLMASGYVHLDAVANKIYMEALNDKQSIAMCIIDLAEGYNKAFPANDGAFPMLACEIALRVYPHYINGRILRAETIKKILEQKIEKEGGEFSAKIREKEEYKETFLAMQHEYAVIHHAGYRRMPEEMYLKWLSSLNAEREKYINKEITNRNKSN